MAIDGVNSQNEVRKPVVGGGASPQNAEAAPANVDLKDAKAKISYLENLKKIAADCATADEFKTEVNKQYPDYSGANYLDMTAGFFFA